MLAGATIVLATAGLYPLDGAIENAYLKSAVVVLEADLDDRSSSAHQSLLMTRGLYLDGTKWLRGDNEYCR